MKYVLSYLLLIILSFSWQSSTAQHYAQEFKVYAALSKYHDQHKLWSPFFQNPIVSDTTTLFIIVKDELNAFKNRRQIKEYANKSFRIKRSYMTQIRKLKHSAHWDSAATQWFNNQANLKEQSKEDISLCQPVFFDNGNKAMIVYSFVPRFEKYPIVRLIYAFLQKSNMGWKVQSEPYSIDFSGSSVNGEIY